MTDVSQTLLHALQSIDGVVNAVVRFDKLRVYLARDGASTAAVALVCDHVETTGRIETEPDHEVCLVFDVADLPENLR